ncbi:MAG: FixH family protein [Myxococcales bacterium]|nr:FixH family protein [Myxococcales bacterium]
MWWWIAACSGGSDVVLTGDTDDDCAGADTFVAGIEVESSGGELVSIVSAEPTPPDVGDNTWTVAVADASGAPMAGLAPVVRPWMPMHGHGLAPPEYVGIDQADGTYVVPTFDLIMPGLWEFTVDLGDGDQAMFSFCAEG